MPEALPNFPDVPRTYDNAQLVEALDVARKHLAALTARDAQQQDVIENLAVAVAELRGRVEIAETNVTELLGRVDVLEEPPAP